MKPQSSKSISWKQIKQTITRPALTLYALRRKGKSLLRIFSVLTVAFSTVGIGYCLLKGIHVLTAFRKTSTAKNSTIYVEYITTGSLQKDWVLQAVHFNPNSDIMEIDIFSLKKDLETIPQIKEALVERIFPSTLKLSIKEHIPMLRVAIQEAKNKKPSIFVISTEGKLYTSSQCPAYVLQHLPFVTDIHLEKQKGGLKPLQGLKPVAEFLDKAAKYKQQLYAEFKFLSLKKFDPCSKQAWSVIKIITHNQKEWIFAPYDFLAQLERLDYILQTMTAAEIKKIKKIDLSFDEEAVVEFIGTSTPSSIL